MSPIEARTEGPSAPSSPANPEPPLRAVKPRSRFLHWTAWAAALVSVVLLVLWRWGPPEFYSSTLLQRIDIGLAIFFAIELFTRTGWRQSRTTYLKWRWFDFVALVPVTALGPFAVAPVIWIVLVCRVVRLVDRTVGDGFVQRNAIVLLGAVEEEISDKVLEKMMTRWERELKDAKFGQTVARALERNREAVLARIYQEQLQEGVFAKIAHITGIQSTIEREEARLFAAMIEMIGSAEVDAAISDVIASSMRRTREQLGSRDWKSRIGREKRT